jgi:hypothetical protein
VKIEGFVMIYRLIVVLVLGLIGSSISSTNSCEQAEQQGNEQSIEPLPVCLKPEQLLDQAHILETFEACKKTIINHKLQIYKALTYLKLLVEKAYRSIDDKNSVNRENGNKSERIDNDEHGDKGVTEAQWVAQQEAREALEKCVEHIQFFVDVFRPQLYVHLKNVSNACTILVYLENRNGSKNGVINWEDIEFLQRIIEKLEKEKGLIVGFIAAVENKRKILDSLIDDVRNKAIVVE